ncbi:UNVERIFIED_CONTAM: hypothetical protein Slati_0372100 [Sesamum latifolium]|uniref:Uncharacterized protein n=1 Tax=Sesamum latifolium TaxID=2727402 RepID=A0AAW2YGM8_9LAMI
MRSGSLPRCGAHSSMCSSEDSTACTAALCREMLCQAPVPARVFSPPPSWVLLSLVLPWLPLPSLPLLSLVLPWRPPLFFGSSFLSSSFFGSSFLGSSFFASSFFSGSLAGPTEMMSAGQFFLRNLLTTVTGSTVPITVSFFPFKSMEISSIPTTQRP